MENPKASYQKIEERLAALQQSLNEIQSLSNIGSWEWNIKTGEVMWSKMMYKLLGLDPNEDEPSYELALHHVHEKDKERYGIVLGNALENKTSYYLENDITCKDKSLISVISRGECYKDVEGNIVRMIGTIQDISQQKEIERLRQEKETAQKSEKLKSAFFANVSHEIRTPLNAIMGFAKMLQDENILKKNKDICLKQIRLGSEKLLKIVSDIIDLSKIETENQKLEYEAFSLNHILNDLLEEVTIGKINPEVQIALEKSLPDAESNILTDKVRLTQILSNLISNAQKFTKKGSIKFGYTLDDSFIKFFVKDTGIGISDEDQELIFERFGQIKNKDTKMVSGVGIGIPISKGLVELFGGELWLESQINEGSSFYFTIPYINNSQVSSPLVPHEERKQKEITVLIAEDDEANFYLFEMEFGDQFNILRANNGKEAIDLHTNHPEIDIVIMDLRMPLMDGIEATIEIRKTDKEIPIFAHTAFDLDSPVLKNIKEIGMNEILIKPSSFENTMKMIKMYCRPGR